MTELVLLPDPSGRLETAFARVQAEKMQGLAFVNLALRVEAVAFAPWKHYWLGVMLTPWAMNLLLAPREIDRWRSLPAGEKRRYVFPAGEFDFISARDDAIGEFLICSLYSPVLQFADHATARATARFALDALFDATHAEANPAPSERRPGDVESPAATGGRLAQIEAQLAAPVSREELVHGRLRRRSDGPRR
jgi:[NiFe] hydrogenase assembly HybE family chaperone